MGEILADNIDVTGLNEIFKTACLIAGLNKGYVQNFGY